MQLSGFSRGHFSFIFINYSSLPLPPDITMTVYPAGSSFALSFAPPSVRFEESLPTPDMQEEFTALGDIMHVQGKGSNADKLKVLVGLSSDALWDGLCASSNQVCCKEWEQHGGLDGSLECDVCCVTSITCVPSDLVFYSASSKATGCSVTLCESCFGGTWLRLGRCIFQTIRPALLLLLVESAESLLWIANQAELLHVSLGRGHFKMRGELPFPGGQGRFLQEGINGVSEDKKEVQSSSCLVLV